MAHRLLSDTRGVSALEFALLSPLFLTLLLGGVELQRYMRLERKLSIAASAVAQSIAQRQPNDQSLLNSDFDIVAQAIPELYGQHGSAWWTNVGHQISIIVFTKADASCKTSCSFRAQLSEAWPSYWGSFAIPFDDLTRSCGELTYSPPGATPTGKTLAVPFAAGSIIAVDLRVRYTPLIGSTWLPEALITRHGYAAPRFATPKMEFPTSQGATLKCPGV